MDPTLYIVLGAVALLLIAVLVFAFRSKSGARPGSMTDMIGKKGYVTEEIDELAGCGQVEVSGQSWSARTLEGDETIPVGTTVEVVGAEGVTLICRR